MHYKLCLHPRFIIKKVEQVTQLQVRISHLMLYSIPLRQNKLQQKFQWLPHLRVGNQIMYLPSVIRYGGFPVIIMS
jgi:hypothetical protein